MSYLARVTSGLRLATALSAAALHALSCASANDEPRGASSSSAEIVVTWEPPATRQDAKDLVSGKEAATLIRLGGTFLCDQSAFPLPDGTKISAWEWAFTTEADNLATKLERELPGAERDGLAFTFPGPAIRPSATVAVRPLPMYGSALFCPAPPAGTKTYVFVTRR